MGGLIVNPAPAEAVDKRPPLLFLVHRIPYPPNKGDKIRSYHVLRYLARDYRVYLGTFIDDPEDEVHRAILQQWCVDSCVLSLNPRWAKVRSLRGLLTGRALTLPYYASTVLGDWVRRTVREQNIRHIVVLSSAMAQFVVGRDFAASHRIMDFIDVDSDKWRQYALGRRWPMSWLYRREANRLLCFERSVAAEFDAAVFVSEHEAALFRQLAPRQADKVEHIYNGVDSQYWVASTNLASPYAVDTPVMVFVGAMDYWPNVDAVIWFVDEILPRVRAVQPAAVLYIVGSRPTAAVVALGRRDGVIVTGRVDDVRPYVQYAALSVAPLRIARGIQNKVLESMAMACATVVTPQALEGIPADSGREVLLADGAEAFVKAVLQLLGDTGMAVRLGSAARELVQRQFAWDSNLARLGQLLEGPDHAA